VAFHENDILEADENQIAGETHNAFLFTLTSPGEIPCPKPVEDMAKQPFLAIFIASPPLSLNRFRKKTRKERFPLQTLGGAYLERRALVPSWSLFMQRGLPNQSLFCSC
jgi:hypothetical protein